jgi:integrase
VLAFAQPGEQHCLSVRELQRIVMSFGGFARAVRIHIPQSDIENCRCANIIRLILLTGARRGEAMNARWDQLDLENAIWTKPAATTKQRRLHRVPLSHAAVELLRRIRAGLPADCPWVFPGEIEGNPITEMQTFWEGIRVKADLPDIRIHDLRHTFASLLVSDYAAVCTFV